MPDDPLCEIVVGFAEADCVHSMEISVPPQIAGDREFRKFAEDIGLSPRPPDQGAALARLLREVPRLIEFARKRCFCEGEPTPVERRAREIAEELHLCLECCDIAPDGFEREVLALVEEPHMNAQLRELDAIVHAKRQEKSAGKRTIGPSAIELHLDEYAGATTYTDGEAA